MAEKNESTQRVFLIFSTDINPIIINMIIYLYKTYTFYYLRRVSAVVQLLKTSLIPS